MVNTACNSSTLGSKLSFSIYVENAVFDASQYDFFGKDVMEEVELGGLEEDADDGPGLINTDDKDYQAFPDNSRVKVTLLIWID